ncbi:DUF6886 family protein [Paenibacillus sp.]|uniref:DUF6886 family protein n=1 Tax=Paenibacillus sp. TaxID=58172 RepID=UPI002D22E42F|nr:DUF6886 family protein [Paenibacillus sp.]HZG88436.1 hypothetical protein [Paenibacillus sp.]
MKLYHFSEESSIAAFVPRQKENRKNMPPVVWAIDEAHAFTFYFPRACPRIVYTRTDDIDERDAQTFFGTSGANIVVTVETAWFGRIRSAVIYRYHLPAETFRLFDEYAGYYISTETVAPLAVEPLDRLLERLMELGVEVRFTPDLHPLRNAILQSSLRDFGIHQFANFSRA